MDGTALPVETHSDIWQLQCVGLGEAPRLRQGKVVAATGELQYSSGCILQVRRKDGTVSADKSAGIYVIEPAASYELGVIYRAEGRIYVQPWSPDSANARTQLSIVVERLVPVGGVASSNGRAKEAASA